MMTLHLYNTESRQKEPLVPSEDQRIRMYTCGPTVYHFAHIGNFRTYVFEDLLRRTIKYFGIQVTQVMNLTDVDDKTIKGAIEGNVTLEEFTKPYKEAFFEDLRTLHIEPAEHYPAATQFLPEMIEMIQGLLQKVLPTAQAMAASTMPSANFPATDAYLISISTSFKWELQNESSPMNMRKRMLPILCCGRATTLPAMETSFGIAPLDQAGQAGIWNARQWP